MAGPPLEAAWRLADAWPAAPWSCAVVHGIEHETVTRGDTSRVQRIASVSKPIAAWAVLVAVEEGTVALDDPVGQSGCTLAHLLSHAGGYPFEGAQPVGKPGVKRIYSNSGYDMIASHIEASSGMPFDEYLADAVLSPLGMESTSLQGSCAKDIWSSVDDLVAFIGELRSPRLVARETWLAAVTPQFPQLEGIVPGIGPADPCPWGLGPEIRGHKSPHWTGARNSAATFGHFGGIGTFLWVDPVADAACVMLSETEFDEWGLAHWPVFSDAVLEGLGR
ncbi:MAG: serine hydrolase domain-containing protein [Actinomycetota bacterium]